MSELPDGIPPAELEAPRDSASGVVMRRADDGRWSVLMGVRSRRSSFMPGHLAFPGGLMDPEDRPEDRGAFERCASRELLEETGVALPVDAWIAAGERITPPLFPVRFRTRFFVGVFPQGASEAATLVPPTDEIESLRFAYAGEVLAEWSAGRCKVPPPTLPILRAIERGERDDAQTLAVAIAAANTQEQRAPRIEFTPGIWMLPLRTATLPPATHTNVWMPGGRRFAVVDPGTDAPEELERLFEVVERRRALGEEPAGVLLTHHHRDHIGGALEVARKLEVELRAHPETLASAGSNLGGAPLGEPIADGEEIDLGGVVLRAHHTPGHAAGHLAFHIVPMNLLIAGDLVSGLSTILIDPRSGDMSDYLESLKRMRDLGCRMLLPGHGPPLPAKALQRLLDHRQERERNVAAQLGKAGSDLAAIARTVYADVPQMPAALVQGQTLAHLIRLEKLGRARREDPAGTRWQAPTRDETAPSSPPGASTPERIRSRLKERFDPVHLRLRDDSANHVGHAGASSGGGHYKLLIVASEFEGLTLLERHRLVNETLSDLFGGEIHALALKTLAPGEWNDAPS